MRISTKATINVHTGSVNQIFPFRSNENYKAVIGDFLTISDDSQVIIWERFKPLNKFETDSVTCITRIGNIAIGGCNNGSLCFINLKSKNIQYMDNAHQNLVRCIINLEYHYKN